MDRSFLASRLAAPYRAARLDVPPLRSKDGRSRAPLSGQLSPIASAVAVGRGSQVRTAESLPDIATAPANWAFALNRGRTSEEAPEEREDACSPPLQQILGQRADALLGVGVVRLDEPAHRDDGSEELEEDTRDRHERSNRTRLSRPIPVKRGPCGLNEFDPPSRREEGSQPTLVRIPGDARTRPGQSKVDGPVCRMRARWPPSCHARAVLEPSVVGDAWSAPRGRAGAVRGLPKR